MQYAYTQGAYIVGGGLIFRGLRYTVDTHVWMHIERTAYTLGSQVDPMVI
jgi:hypothetical protein